MSFFGYDGGSVQTQTDIAGRKAESKSDASKIDGLLERESRGTVAVQYFLNYTRDTDVSEGAILGRAFFLPSNRNPRRKEVGRLLVSCSAQRFKLRMGLLYVQFNAHSIAEYP